MTTRGTSEPRSDGKRSRRRGRRDRDRWLPRIKWVVLVSAVVWTTSGVELGVLIFEVSNLDRPGLFETLYKWSQIAGAAAQPLTIGGFALYVMLWLEDRRGR